VTPGTQVFFDACTLSNFATVGRLDLLEKLAGCPEAYRILESMARAGRGVALPPSHLYVCSPS
jgi:hypothetical protein